MLTVHLLEKLAVECSHEITISIYHLETKHCKKPHKFGIAERKLIIMMIIDKIIIV
jgi:hypothetical protein